MSTLLCNATVLRQRSKANQGVALLAMQKGGGSPPKALHHLLCKGLLPTLLHHLQGIALQVMQKGGFRPPMSKVIEGVSKACITL